MSPRAPNLIANIAKIANIANIPRQSGGHHRLGGEVRPDSMLAMLAVLAILAMNYCAG
jgi:hypothetical protein